jgi:RHS repeat-associated protein
MKYRIAWGCLVWLLPFAASFDAAAAQPSLTITAAQLLANDRPGPANESSQTLTVTAIRTTAATHGSATFANGTVTYVPDAGFAGAAVLFYTACDNGTTNGQPDPRCSETSITVNLVLDHPPTANTLTLTTAEDSSIAVNLTATDPDGDSINYVIVTQPNHGTLTGTAPALTYVPAPDFNGLDSFTFAANDGQTQSAAATVNITVTEVNDPPVPEPDRMTVAAGKPATVATSFLLANDVAGPFNESSQTLTVTSATAGAATHGTVTLSAAGVVYTPDAGFTGTSVIPYTVCDNGTTNGQPDPRCANSTLAIVLNSPPVANAQSAQAIRTSPIALVLAAADPDGDPLQYAIVAAPLHGTLTGTPPAVTYVANSGYIGNDSFTFTAADPYSTSNAATVSIVVQDVPPVVLGPDSLTVAAGGSLLVNVLANDVAGTGTMNPATLLVSTPPTKGVAVVQIGQILYTPNTGASGTDSFLYKACDTGGACGTAPVTATITTNHSPTAKADSYQIDAGKTLTVTAPGLLANDSDPDAGDQIQARLGTGVGAGNLLLRSDGSFTYTPAAGFAGADSFTYFDVDLAGLPSPPVTVTINVIPAGPLAVDDTYQTTAGSPLTVGPSGVLANDSDSHSTGPLTAGLNRDAIHGSVALNPDGSFVYTPDPTFVGADSFLYVAVDLQGLVSTPAHVTVNVAAAAKTLPTVAVASPVSGSCVKAPVGITANLAPATGETITQWNVSARNLDGGDPVVLASGSGPPPQTLATFDPTLLVNGAYQILTTAMSSGGGTRTFTTDVCVAGNNKLGDYQTTYLDMQTSIAGFPVQVLRTYDTTDSRRGDFGIGWRLDLSGPRATPNGRLGESGWSTTPFGQPFTQYSFSTTVPHFVTVTSPGGRVEVFDLAPVATGPLLSLTTPAFVARPGTGTTSTLEDVDAPTLSLAGDSLAGFFDGALYDPRLFRLTTKNGVVMYIDRYNGLQYMSDRNGNALVFGANGVTAASSNTPRQLAFVRDGAGRITEIDGPNGKRTLYAYSGVGDLSQFTDATGAMNTFSYNAAHRLLSVAGPGGVKLRTLNYGPDGRLTSLTDGTGRTITLSSNVNANSQIVTSPSGGLTTLSTYGADGNLASKEEAFNGHSRVTSYRYDSEGRLTQTTKPLGRVETLTYDAAGNITSRTTPKNEKWTYAFNALNEPTTTTAPDGTVIESFTYDALGNLTAATNRDGTVVTYTNNSQGLPVTATDSFGATTFTYDADQQLITQTDPAGGVTRQAYDSSGNVVSIQNPAGETTHFARNGLDQLVQMGAANGSTYALAYDAFGRLTSFTDAAGRTRGYQYDVANRLVKSVDRASRSATYAYDTDGNLATLTYADGEVQTATWDPVGRLISLTDADSIVERSYNDANDLVSERTRGNNGVALPDVTLSYTTDADGQRVSSSGPGGGIVYAYDSRGRLSSLHDNASGVFTLTYDATDRLTGLSRPNGVNDVLSYQENHLVARNASVGGSMRARAEYALDALGRRTALTDLDGSHAFAHDLADRLTSATHPAASGLAPEAFTYDSVGNRTSWSGSPSASVNYDAGMQLTSDGTFDYAYDAEGRLTQRRNRGTGGIAGYSWSDAGTLKSITAPDGTTSTYRYDALGRRLEANDAGVVRRFVYSGWNLHNEFDGTNALRATYVTGIDLNSVFEVVRDGVSYYPLFDGLRSVVALTDGTGAVVGRRRYGAFGVSNVSGTIDNGFAFTGHQYDIATGLSYARARYYDPTIGRFLSQDPEPSINPYPYDSDDPIDKVDPSGRSDTAEYTEETGEEDTFIARQRAAPENPAPNNPVDQRVGCYFRLFGEIAGFFGAAEGFISPAERVIAHEVAEQQCMSLFGPDPPFP